MKAEIYEAEYDFWPWGKLIRFVAEWVEKNAPANACVLDYMCGTGFLLNQVAENRPDLDCYGCSLTPEYIDYAQQAYPLINIELCDAQKYKPKRTPDIVICTAGLHHLPWDFQGPFIKKVASEMGSGKIFIIGEELIRVFKDERERRFAVIEMINGVLCYMTDKKAPPDIIATAADVLKADLLAQEYKIDITTLTKILFPYFDIEKQYRFWPEDETGYGDYVFICRRH